MKKTCNPLHPSFNEKKFIVHCSLIIVHLIISAGISAKAQTGYDAVISQIETNNTTLAALRQQTEADKIGNRTGLMPANPEVEFNYLWGNPSPIGTRTDINIKQTFDFPTAYAHRSKIASLQNENAELAYKAERINILSKARQTCIELAYYSALTNEYALRLKNAEYIAEAYKTKLERGETNILEHNKAQLNLSSVQAETARTETEQKALLSELKQLNGGNEIQDLKFNNQDLKLPDNFEEWYATVETQNPILIYVRGQMEVGKEEIKLNRAMGLPGFSAGYMSEKVVGQHFQGITAGVSIPLWENKNRVRRATAQVQAAEYALNDVKIQFYNRLQMHYHKAVALLQNAQTLRQSLDNHNNEPLLKKSLEAGEISLLTYLLEIEFYYEAINKVLEAERDFELAVSELRAVEL